MKLCIHTREKEEFAVFFVGRKIFRVRRNGKVHMHAYIYQNDMFCAGRPASGCVGTVCLQVN